MSRSSGASASDKAPRVSPCAGPFIFGTNPRRRTRIEMKFCLRFNNVRFVCEAHPDHPWEDGPRACRTQARKPAKISRITLNGGPSLSW